MGLVRERRWTGVYPMIAGEQFPRFRRRGMGEYPGYYCFDANRPSWLPYWVSSPTELACQLSPSTIVGNIKACVTGDPSCGTPTAAQANPDLSGPGVAGPGEVANVPTCTGLYSLDVATNTCSLNPLSNTPLLLAVGAGLVLVLVLIGGRR